MIEIDLNLFVTLAKYMPPAGPRLRIEEGTTLGELADMLSIPRDQVKLAFVNGKKQPFGTVLSRNDRVGFFPPVGGG